MSDLELAALPRKFPVSQVDRETIGRWRDSDAEDWVAEIIKVVEEAKQASGDDPFVIVRALVDAERLLGILVEVRYERFRGLNRSLGESLDQIAGIYRRALVRWLMRNEIEPVKAKEILAELEGQINTGAWPQWESEIDEAARAAVAK